MFRLIIAILTFLFLGSATATATTGPDESRLQPNAVAVAEYVMANYPEVPEISGRRADPLPDHPSGHAVDIMVFDNAELGDRILADLLSHPELGIRYMIWQQQVHRPNGSGYIMASRGSLRADHFDHIHVTVN